MSKQKAVYARVIVRAAITAQAYVEVHGASFDYVMHPPLSGVRAVQKKTEYIASSFNDPRNKSSVGSIPNDLIMWSWIKHGARYGVGASTDKHGYTHISLQGPLARIMYLMARGKNAWARDLTDRLRWAMETSVTSGNGSVANVYGLVSTEHDMMQDHQRMGAYFDKEVWQVSMTPPVSMPHPASPEAAARIPQAASSADALFGSTPPPPRTQKAAPTMSTTPAAAPVTNFDDIMNAVSQIQPLCDKVKQLETDNASLISSNNDLNSELSTTATELSASVKAHADTNGALIDVRKELSIAKVSGGTTVNKIDIGDHSSANAAGNDLDAIAKALNIQRDELDDQLTAFKRSCAIHLPNKVAWVSWCDPAEPFSKAMYNYRNNVPTVVTGPSGSGKTFILEAMCEHIAGVRCLVTYHALLTYSKLFARERVGAGRTFWQLGPIPMAMLCGVPVIHDEFDHGDVHLQSLTHVIMDTRVCHLADVGISIMAADGFQSLFTCNSLTDGEGDYHGEVGSAMKTRFASIFADYASEKEEAVTIDVACDGLDKKICQRIAGVYKALRADEKHRKLTGPFSVREACAIGRMVKKMMSDGATEVQAMTQAYQMFVIDKRPVTEQAVAAETIQTAGGIDASNPADADEFMSSILGKL